MARHDVRSMETPYQFSDWLVLSSENLCSQQSKLAVYGYSSVSRQVTTQPQRRCFCQPKSAMESSQLLHKGQQTHLYKDRIKTSPKAEGNWKV